MRESKFIELIPPPARPVFEDFTVTAVGPLRIQRDGDASELPFTPDTLISTDLLSVDDRVRVELSGGRLIVHGRADGLAVNPVNPNLIINGTFRTNQTGYVSGASLADEAYFFDQWKATVGATQVSFTADAHHGQEITFYGSNSKRIGQIVERSRIEPGDYVLSWEGTAKARFYTGGAYVSSTTASPLVVTLDGTDDVLVEFTIPSGTSATLNRVKLERGSVPTPFILDPLEVELQACYRYFQRILAGAGEYGFTGQATTATVGFGLMRFFATMRAAPTITRSATASHFRVFGAAGANLDLTNLTFTAITARYASFTANVASGLTAGQAVILISNHSTAYIDLDARL